MKPRNLLLSHWMTFSSIFLMLSGFLFSRALLSIGMIVLLLNALYPPHFKENRRRLKESRFVLFCFLFFLVFFISGLWSENKDAWMKDVQVKLPFLILPFSMLATDIKSDKMKDRLLYLILLLLGIGMFYSLVLVVQNPSRFLRGAHILGPVENDYLRFSLALVLGINIVFYFFIERRKELTLLAKMLLGVWAVIAAIYLHIQASKLGILSFYVLLGIYLVYFFYKKPFKHIGLKQIIVGVVSMVILILSSLQLPTIQRQIEKTNREKIAFETKDEEFVGGSFMARIISYQAAFRVIRKHPVLGVGSGDWKVNMEKEYQNHYPQLKKSLIPHNEFIFTMLAVGIPLSLTFWLLLLSPLFRKTHIAELATVLVMICGTMIEALLEVQFGIFVYLFFTLLWILMKQKEAVAVE